MAKKTPKPDPVAEASKRKVFMLEKLRKAMLAILHDPKFDWSRESEDICTAASTLMEKVQEYIEDRASETDVKILYKAYVGMYARG